MASPVNELIANWLFRLVFAYASVGLVFALAFVFRGVNKIDPVASESSLGFRLAILPGSAALWPLLLRRWVSGSSSPVERNPHRDRARVTE